MSIILSISLPLSICRRPSLVIPGLLEGSLGLGLILGGPGRGASCGGNGGGGAADKTGLEAPPSTRGPWFLNGKLLPTWLIKF